MRPIEKWIWLPQDVYPECQIPRLSCLNQTEGDRYTVAAFSRTYELHKPVKNIRLRYSGDAAFRLYMLTENGRHFIASGPASPGGDFLYAEKALPNFYAFRSELTAEGELADSFECGKLTFYAEVQMNPTVLFSFSRGHGGFMLTAEVRFADGSKTVLLTDESWTAKRLGAYTAPDRYDSRVPDGEECQAAVIKNIWYTEDAPISPCSEQTVFPSADAALTVEAGKTETYVLPLEKIYACYLHVAADAPGGNVTAEVQLYETDESGECEELFLCGRCDYRGFSLHSAGGIRLKVQNNGDKPATLMPYITVSNYPVTQQAVTTTSDYELNLVMQVCAHTLKICRQTLHLDSPRHCEPLACTGDYYIESLMTAFTYSDMRLAEFDIRRTAELLRYRNGRMFHTTYSLIWVQMLWDTYLFTGNTALLKDCEEALILLMERFKRYIGENGLIETPPDYMFIDWLCPDGISTHHPPKALGQTCLCLYYYGALKTACNIYNAIEEPSMARQMQEDAAAIKQSILRYLYDEKRGLFFEGLNTPSPEKDLYNYLPQNTEKRYYRRHANILASYFGILEKEESRSLLRRIWKDDSLGEVQPYFTHFWLEAIYRNGLRDEMTLPLLERWKAPVRDCSKGLAEGFYKPEPSYHFDHSHAWGGTPAYALPKALSGIEILEAGYKKIRLSPSLLGLRSAHVEIPTCRGMIVLDMEEGSAPSVKIPGGITAVAFTA